MARPSNPELRNEILKAAAFIIEDCGPDCVTMREVAEKIGYSPTTIYLYFKDKGAVLRECIRLAFEELADACVVASVGPRALDKLRQRSRAYVVWGIMHPGHYRLMFEYAEEVQPSDEDYELVHANMAWLRDIVAEAIAAGELPAEADAAEMARVVWAALHGSTSLSASRRLVPGLQNATALEAVEAATATADRLLNCLLAGVGA